ncbi:hypothetical protein [Bacteroides ihuae]|uniref:hypothetical protein n=1 Tax=Bacteroides ihuae TaxID=1852362 RepID=UPI0011147EB7|nr:hypothetical protein [Bacteroides ihuae]
MNFINKSLLVLSLVFLCSSCSNDDTTSEFYTYYNLPSDYNTKIKEDKIIVINDEIEFQKLLSDYPHLESVDFGKSTLLLIEGISMSGIEKIDKQISKAENNKYEVIINVKMNLATVVEPWHVAYLIPKTNAEDIVFTINYL